MGRRRHRGGCRCLPRPACRGGGRWPTWPRCRRAQHVPRAAARGRWSRRSNRRPAPVPPRAPPRTTRDTRPPPAQNRKRRPRYRLPAAETRTPTDPGRKRPVARAGSARAAWRRLGAYRAGPVFRLDLPACLLGQVAAHAHHSDVVLIEQLATARVGVHRVEHLTVLLQHGPVSRLEGGAEQEAPRLARDAFHLARAPEEDAAGTLIDRRDEADDR